MAGPGAEADGVFVVALQALYGLMRAASVPCTLVQPTIGRAEISATGSSPEWSQLVPLTQPL